MNILMKLILNTPLRRLWVPLRWLYIKYIHKLIRVLFVRPEVSVAVFGLFPTMALVGYRWTQGTNPEPLVLATTFYASVIFFKEVFLSDYPLIEIYPFLRTSGTKFNIHYEALNSGNKAVSNVKFAYRIYDRDGRWLKGPEQPESHADYIPISLEPGQGSEKYRIQLEKSFGFKSDHDGWDQVEADTPTPIFIELSASPNIGHRFLGDKEILRIDPSNF
jgi:hypothetical protein